MSSCGSPTTWHVRETSSPSRTSVDGETRTRAAGGRMVPAQWAPQQSSALMVPAQPRHSTGWKQNPHPFHSVRRCAARFGALVLSGEVAVPGSPRAGTRCLFLRKHISPCPRQLTPPPQLHPLRCPGLRCLGTGAWCGGSGVNQLLQSSNWIPGGIQRHWVGVQTPAPMWTPPWRHIWIQQSEGQIPTPKISSIQDSC